MNIFETFRDKWIKQKLDVHPPKDEQSILDCFKIFGISASKDLLYLYSTMDGKDCMDEEYFRLWKLNEVFEENSSRSEIERTKKYGVLFADYCVNCWCYRINANGEVLIDYFTEGKEPEIRAGSITDFFQLMANSPDEALL